MGQHYSYPLTDIRERQLERLMEQSDCNTKAEALDSAINHYLETVDNLESAAEDLTPNQAKMISTSEVSLTMYPKVR